jgi:hypothetical protein
VTTVAMNVATDRELDFLQLFTVSPSLGLGALWLLGGALVFTEHLRDRIGWPHLLLALLAVGCVGGKTSHAAVLGGGVGLVALMSLRTPEFRAKAWWALGTVSLSVAAAFVALILGSSGNLVLATGASAVTFGILPNGTALGLAVGTVGVCLVLAAKWAGVAVLLADRHTAGRPEVWFGVGAAVTGLLLMAVLGHPGSSQLYFPVSAGLVVGVVSAWGLGELAGRLPWGWLGAAGLAGAAAGVVGAARPGDWPAWTIPFLVWLVPFGLAAAALVLVRQRPRPRVAAAVLGWGLLVASLVAGTAAVWESLRSPAPADPAAHATGSWTESHEAALRWLRDNAAEDDVVLTNRQCSAPQLGSAECAPQRWFLTAALGQRRMYIEGADYAAGLPHPAWVDDRVALSRRFVDEPTRADAEVLWDDGVRWVVVDLASTTNRNWEEFTEPAFTNGTTHVLRLLRP